MMRFSSCTIALLLVMASAPSASASWCGESGARSEPIHVVTICELAHWGEARVGTRARIRVEYFTDLRHGAFLSDPKCPLTRLQLGVRSADADADASLAMFDKALGQHYDYYVGRKFKVGIIGSFELEEARILYQELPPDRQLRILAHGVLSLLKVWSFEKPTKRPDSHGTR